MSEPISPRPTDRPADAAVIQARVRRVGGSAGQHFWELAWWKKALLVFAVVLAVVGIAGAVTGTFRSKPPEVKSAQVEVETLRAQGQRSSLTDEQQQQLKTADNTVNTYRHWFYDKTAPQLWRIGIGFFIAFILGFMARQFLKTMAVLAAVAVVLAAVAVYFGLLDSGGLKSNVTTGTGWVMDRLDSMKETLLKFVGTSLSGTAGFVIGFMRPRR